MPLSDVYKQKFNENLEKNREVGFVEKISNPIYYVSGLPSVKNWEVVYFENGCMGLVISLLEDYSEVMSFGNESISVGTKVSRSGELINIPVGETLLGKVINPLGMSMYEDKLITGFTEYRKLENIPPGIESRVRITDPLETGISMVDFLIPLGKGQRELIIGDRNIGKTTFVLQSILSQAKKGTICVYAGIGKKKHSLKEVEDFFEKHNIRDKTIIVGSSSSDSIANIYLTPYAAMTISEYFKDNGYDVLLILDDLTTHAKYYREMSLITKKFPGRDAYPGDIFYAHARLLERAGNFKINDNKTASITCFPIAETIGGDISGYIQTNLMSITDGHIFFDLDLYKMGKRPAINYFLSVTRVGRQTQTGVRWGINRELTSFTILLNKTERFIHFGAEINEGIKSTLRMGDYINFFFDQSLEEILDLNVQIFIFGLLWSGILQEESEGKIKFYINESQKIYISNDSFKKKLDDLVESCKDFNELLAKIGSEHKALLSIIDSYYEKKL